MFATSHHGFELFHFEEKYLGLCYQHILTQPSAHLMVDMVNAPKRITLNIQSNLCLLVMVLKPQVSSVNYSPIYNGSLMHKNDRYVLKAYSLTKWLNIEKIRFFEGFIASYDGTEWCLAGSKAKKVASLG